MPANARTGANGIRIYTWAEPGEEPVEVISVTSIRKMNGIPMGLQNWMLSNVVNLATGQRQVVRIGPRGGVKKVYVRDGDFPGQFMERMAATEGNDEKLNDVRKWLRNTADEPRDRAAVRGSVVHELIEHHVPYAGLTPAIATFYIEGQQRRDKREWPVDEDDINFVMNALRQYEHMRVAEPFVILAQEPQVWNLSLGYAGSADVLIWLLPASEAGRLDYWQGRADRKELDADDIRAVGGVVAVGDWKTASDVYVDNIVQVTAYAIGEFIGLDGVRDERLTGILTMARRGAIVHIRPDGWSIDHFRVREDIVYAFMGSVAFARFLAMNPTIAGIVDEHKEGQADDTAD